MRNTSFSLNGPLADALARALERDRVGPRGKSRWICERIRDLIRDDPQLESVGASESLEVYPRLHAVRIDAETDKLIEAAYRIVRAIDPQADGVQSALIRAAIRKGAARVS